MCHFLIAIIIFSYDKATTTTILPIYSILSVYITRLRLYLSFASNIFSHAQRHYFAPKTLFDRENDSFVPVD